MGDHGGAKKRKPAASAQPAGGAPGDQPAQADQSAASPSENPAAPEDPRDLAAQIAVALAPIQVYGLVVTADARGVAVLDGTVRTEQNYLDAERMTRQVPGIRRVINQLVIETLTGSMPMQSTVLSPEIAAEIELNQFSIARSVEDDLNREIGTTDTAEATDEAEPYFPPTDPPTIRAPRDAQGFQVTGGFSQTSLDAPIGLEQLPNRLLGGDDEIARLVRMALREDASTTDLPIAVLARDGIVHLRGVVQTIADAEQAEAVASNVPGVVEVIEELDVVGI